MSVPAGLSSPSARDVTFYYERIRAGAFGVLETAVSTFLLLIAVRHFGVGKDAIALALLAGAYFMGLLVGPVVVYVVTRGGWQPARAAAVMCLIGGTGFALAAVVPAFPAYLIGSMLGTACISAIMPLVVQMTHDNYPATERGLLFSRTILVRIAVVVMFGYAAGSFINDHYDRYPYLLAIFSLAMWTGAFTLARCPSTPLPKEQNISPLVGLQLVREDRTFRWLLIAWMYIGFGNLMMLALRVPYLAEAEFGFAYSAAIVALLTSVMPAVSRFIMTTVWGRLFDRVNFFKLRIAINMVFLAGIYVFYTAESLPMFIVGAMLFGAAAGGGEIAWSLWVTKFAKPGKVADYMAVHTFLTGVRGVAAPFVAFTAIATLEVHHLAFLAVGLILASCAIIVPFIWRKPEFTPGQPMTEEVQD